LAVGAVGAEACDGAVDQPRVGLLQHVAAERKAVHDASTVVLDQDIGAAEKLEQNVTPGGIAQVELDAALAAIVGDEMRAVEPAAKAAERIAALRMLDLDHLGERRRDHGAELHHAHALQYVRHAVLGTAGPSKRRMLLLRALVAAEAGAILAGQE